MACCRVLTVLRRSPVVKSGAGYRNAWVLLVTRRFDELMGERTDTFLFHYTFLF